VTIRFDAGIGFWIYHVQQGTTGMDDIVSPAMGIL
jgi:hypothetical protein